MKLRIFSLEGKDVEKVKKLLKTELFARESDGFEMRSGKGLGIEDETLYLYIEGGAEFWKRVETELNELEIEELEGEKLQKVKAAFEKQHKSKALAVGAIFS